MYPNPYETIERNIEYEIREAFEAAGLPIEYVDVEVYEYDPEDYEVEFEAKVYYSFEFFGIGYGITFEIHGTYDLVNEAVSSMEITNVVLG